MSEPGATECAADQFIATEIAGEDARLAARHAVTFLSACVEGQIAEATVGDRIAAARSLLEHAARLPDVLGEIASIADLASEDDVAIVLTALD